MKHESTLIACVLLLLALNVAASMAQAKIATDFLEIINKGDF